MKGTLLALALAVATRSASLEERELDHKKRMRGFPTALVADSEGRNPSYDRQLLGTDGEFGHPWLGTVGGASPMQLVDSVFEHVDKNADAHLAVEELTARMLLAAKLRVVVELRRTQDGAVQAAMADIKRGDANKDGLLSSLEVYHMDEHATKHKPTDVAFPFADASNDGLLALDEVILFRHLCDHPDAVALYDPHSGGMDFVKQGAVRAPAHPPPSAPAFSPLLHARPPRSRARLPPAAPLGHRRI